MEYGIIGWLIFEASVIFKYIHSINILGEKLNGKSLVTERTFVVKYKNTFNDDV